MLHVGINKSHVHIIMAHVDKIYLVYWGHMYATIQTKYSRYTLQNHRDNFNRNLPQSILMWKKSKFVQIKDLGKTIKKYWKYFQLMALKRFKNHALVHVKDMPTKQLFKTCTVMLKNEAFPPIYHTWLYMYVPDFCHVQRKIIPKWLWEKVRKLKKSINKGIFPKK